MSTRSSAKLFTVLALLASVVPAEAQTDSDPSTTAWLRLGPLALTPAIALRDVGIDSNVFNQTDDPKQDVTATFRPELDAWLRLGRGRLSANGWVEGMYFKEYASERAVNAGGSGALEFRGNRLGVSAGGSLSTTRQRTGFEIDLRARQLQHSLTAGGDVRLSGKTALGVLVDRHTVEFDDDESVVPGTSLNEALNRRETTVTAFLNYQLTPLTALQVRTDFQRDTFELSPLRNNRRLRVTPAVEFKPFAVISGRAIVGYQKFEPLRPDEAPFNTAFASVDLAYTLRGRTRFTIQANRDVGYSFQPSQPYYLITGLTGSVYQALSTSWGITARASRQRLDYGQVPFDVEGAALRGGVDTVTGYGAGTVWRLSPDVQLGLNADYQRRRTQEPQRRPFEGLRVGGFFAYAPRGR